MPALISFNIWAMLLPFLLSSRHISSYPSSMMTSSNGNIFRVTGLSAGNSPVPGEFPTQRPVTRSFDVYYDLRPNKRLSKQSWAWWFETLSPPLWRNRNVFSRRNTVLVSNLFVNNLFELPICHVAIFLLCVSEDLLRICIWKCRL